MPIATFLLVAYGWTWLTVLPLLLDRRGILDLGLPDAWQALGAFGPFVAALVVAAREPGGRAAFLASVGRWRGGKALTLGSPFVFLVLAVGVMGLVRGFADPSVLAGGRLGTASGLVDLILVDALLQALGEEPGWRGWLLPRLRQRFGPGTATALLFPAWLFWHLPFFLSRPDFGLAQFGGFALGIASAAVWLTAIRERTQGAAACIAWHALVNITRGVALALAVPVFLAYGMAVTLGALVIIGGWIVRAWRPDPDVIDRG